MVFVRRVGVPGAVQACMRVLAAGINTSGVRAMVPRVAEWTTARAWVEPGRWVWVGRGWVRG